MDNFPNVVAALGLLKRGSSAFYDILRRWAATPQPLSNTDFDIDQVVGFFPSSTLSRLPLGFGFWEWALDDALKLLNLGDDFSDEAMSKRESGERWRQRVREVRSFPNR